MPASYGFLSTHPPTQCGLATFNSALSAHLTAGGRPGGIVRVIAGGDDERAGPGVVHTWSTAQRRRLAGRGRRAQRASTSPSCSTSTASIPAPTARRCCRCCARSPCPASWSCTPCSATPTAAAAVGAGADRGRGRRGGHHDRHRPGPAARRLRGRPRQDHRHPARRRRPHRRTRRAAVPRPHLLTWGLLGPGKGIEWALRAARPAARPRPRLPPTRWPGKTHPKVLEQHGEAYRDEPAAARRASSASPTPSTTQPVYHDQAALSRLIRSADVVVLPYDSREQVTSGVLIEAVAAGVPVVATRFPHAVELLTDGPGLLVPHQDPAAHGRRHPADPDRTRPGRQPRRSDRSADPDRCVAGGGGPLRRARRTARPPVRAGRRPHRRHRRERADRGSSPPPVRIADAPDPASRTWPG